MIRLLLADDYVPDGNLSSDQAIRDHFLHQYSNDQNRDEIAEWAIFLRGLVRLLEQQAYQVDCASTPDQARDLTKHQRYDAIILDLGWYALFASGHIDYDRAMIYGFTLGNEIRQSSPVPILMFSNRYYEKDDLARTAADLGFLPAYKSNDETCKKQVLVTIRWLLDKATLEDRRREEATNHALQMYRDHALRMYKWLSYTLIGSIGLGGILAVVALVNVFRDSLEVTAAATVFGLISSFIGRTIYVYIKKFEESLTGSARSTAARSLVSPKPAAPRPRVPDTGTH
jgi:CheY-like chemotaxis protein